MSATFQPDLMSTFLLHAPGPRPAFPLVAEHLWGPKCNIDSDGNSRSVADEQWTELTLILRADRQQRLDIDPLTEVPLVLAIHSSQAGLGRKAAEFLQAHCGGTLELQAGR